MPGVLVNHLYAGDPDGEGDCAILALKVYLGLDYNDIVRMAVFHDRYAGKRGLWPSTILAIAADLGHRLRKERLRTDSYGVVLVPGHAAVIRHRLVLDRAEVFDARNWIRKFNRKRGQVWVLTSEEIA